MSETKSVVKKYINGLIVLIAAAAIVYFIIQKPQTAFNVLLVLLGFGAVIMIHEFGHFIVAKLGGIKVEAFSIGFPPMLLGIQRLDSGFRIRFLPTLFASEPSKEQQQQQKESAALTAKALSRMTAGRKHKPWDTEYCIGLIPFGGYVKMLGQEDTGAAEISDNPRSFMNKPISIRIAVVAAGVIFNAVSAFLIFMIVFLVGKQLPPPVVGGVQPGSPAEVAGIKAGDRIIQIANKSGKYLDFTDLVMKPALSNEDEAIKLVIESLDGRVESKEIIAEVAAKAAMPLRSLGITQGSVLTVRKGLKDPNNIQKLYDNFGLRPGDTAVAVNNQPVEYEWQLQQIARNLLLPTALVSFKHQDGTESFDREFELYWPVENNNFRTEFDLCHVHSMVPPLKVMAVAPSPKPVVWLSKFKAMFGLAEDDEDGAGNKRNKLKAGDIIIKVGDSDFPTYEELRRATIEYENKEMPITVFRTDAKGAEKTVTVTVSPKKLPNSDRVTFGIFPALAPEYPIVAATIAPGEGIDPLDIPRGAVITAIDGEKVSSFYDIVRIIRKNRGQRVGIDYRIGNDSGGTGLVIGDDDLIRARSEIVKVIPFDYLKEMYKADNLGQAIRMSIDKTSGLVVQTYLTLRRLFTGDVSPKALSGPVGIISISYKIASYSIPDYIYFLGLISAIIAVMNLLPLPIVDGGVIILLIIEKLRGKALSEKVQEIISYAGLVIILALFIWLTYNDLLNLLFK
jgi:regulator of sigma E protease